MSAEPIRAAPERLHPADLRQLADLVAGRVVELLRADVVPPRSPDLVNAAEVARRFGVSAQWARQHADELGAIRLGTGPKARLRFDPLRVDAALTVRSAGKRSQPAAGPKRRRNSKDRPAAAAAGCPLLPVRGPGG